MCGPSLCFWGRRPCARRRSAGACCPVLADRPLSLSRTCSRATALGPDAFRRAGSSRAATGGDGTGSGHRRSRGRQHPLQACRPCNPQGCQCRRSRRSRSVLRDEARRPVGDGDGLLGAGASGPVRDRGGGGLGSRPCFLRAAAGRRAAADPRGAGHRRDQARSRHSEICALREGRAAQPAGGERALRPGAVFARS